MKKITIGALFATALTPLIVDWDHIFAYVFPKVLFFGTVLAIAVIAGAIYFLKVQNRREGKELLARTRAISKSPLFWALVVFLASMGMSAVVSTDPLVSFFGDAERGEGWVMHVHYLLLALFLPLFFSKSHWRAYLWGSLGVGVIAFIYGYLQHFGVEAFPFAQPAQSRAASFLGNATYLAGYTIALFFFVGALLFKPREFFGKRLPLWAPWAIFGGFTVLAGITLLFAQTRGAILAFAVGVMALLLFLALFPRRITLGRISVRLLAVILLAAVLAAGGVLFATHDAEVWDGIPGISRLVNETRLDGSSLVVRRIALNISIDALKDRPWFGWGGDNYIDAFQKHYDPEHFQYSSDWLDRAHNKIAGTAVMYGVMGLLFYLAVLLALFWELAQVVKPRGKKERLAGAIIASALIAYFVQNLPAFDMPTTYIPLFVLVGFLWSRRISRHSEGVEQSSNLAGDSDDGTLRFTQSDGGVLKAAVTVIAVLLIFASLWALYAIRWVPYRQSLAYDELLDKGGSAILAEQERLFEPWSYLQPTLTQRLLQSAQQSGAAIDPRSAELADLATEKLAESAARHVDARPFQLLTNFNIDRAKAIDQKYFAQAEEYARDALERMPERPSIRYLLAVSLSGQGRHEEANNMLEETLRLAPTVPQSYYYLGSALAAKGADFYLLAEEYFDRSVELGMPLQAEDYINFSKAYLWFESWDKASVFVEWAFERVADNMSKTQKIQLHTNAILAYRELRDVDNIVRHANEIYNIAENPDLRRDAQFIIELARRGRWDILDQL